MGCSIHPSKTTHVIEGDTRSPALAPKSLSSPGPSGDAFGEEASECGSVYMSTLSNARPGFTSVSIS